MHLVYWGEGNKRFRDAIRARSRGRRGMQESEARSSKHAPQVRGHPGRGNT